MEPMGRAARVNKLGCAGGGGGLYYNYSVVVSVAMSRNPKGSHFRSLFRPFSCTAGKESELLLMVESGGCGALWGSVENEYSFAV